MSDIAVAANGLSKRFFIPAMRESIFRGFRKLIRGEAITTELWALRDVSFEIKKEEKVALVGKNGAGKTTLLRTAMGIHDATSGSIICSIHPEALLKFYVGLNRDLSVTDNIFFFGAMHGMDRKFLIKRLHHIFTLSELHHVQFSPLKSLSMGEAQRLAVSIFMQSESDFLIFDESLEFVDKSFARKACEYFQELASGGKTIIMTSHDGSILKRFCKRALWLEEGALRMDGEAEKVINEYERSLA